MTIVVLLLFLASLSVHGTAFACSGGIRTVEPGTCHPASCNPSVYSAWVDYTVGNAVCTQIEYFSNNQCNTPHSNPCPAGCTSDAQCNGGTCLNGNEPPDQACVYGNRGPKPWWCVGLNCGVDCQNKFTNTCNQRSNLSGGIGQYPSMSSCQSNCSVPCTSNGHQGSCQLNAPTVPQGILYKDTAAGTTTCGTNAKNAGYASTTNVYCVCTGNTCPQYTVSGTVFTDIDENRTYNTPPDQLGKGTVTITDTNNHDTVVATINVTNGAYTTSLKQGNYKVTFTPPPGFYMTYPLFSVPPSFSIPLGTCTSGTSTHNCQNGNISQLNFGETNAPGWIQSVCGDVRQDTGISNKIPPNPVCGTNTSSGAYMMQQDTSFCPQSPGVAYTGKQSADFGQGQASSNAHNWIVGGPSIVKGSPGQEEVYTPQGLHVLRTSYEALIAQTRQSGIATIDLSDSSKAPWCSHAGTGLNCNLPAALSHGVYVSDRSVTLQANGQTYTFPGGQNYVFLIKGNLTINANITVPVGSTAIFSASGNIEVKPTVGTSDVTSTVSNLDGFYSADQSFTIDGTNTCTDQRINIGGSIIVNAALNGGTFQNNRNLCSLNLSCPSVSVVQRPDLILNAPTFIKTPSHIWEEVPPGTTH